MSGTELDFLDQKSQTESALEILLIHSPAVHTGTTDCTSDLIAAALTEQNHNTPNVTVDM